jgi:hypothetical protein
LILIILDILSGNSQLAILPGLTHYAMGTDPRLAEVAIRFLDETVSEKER